MVAYLEQRREQGKLAIAQFMVLILKSILEQIGGNNASASFLKIINIFPFFFQSTRLGGLLQFSKYSNGLLAIR